MKYTFKYLPKYTLMHILNFCKGGENQTHDPLNPISDALTIKLLEALWRPGSEFTINTTPVIDDNHSSVFFTTEKK